MDAVVGSVWNCLQDCGEGDINASNDVRATLEVMVGDDDDDIFTLDDLMEV